MRRAGLLALGAAVALLACDRPRFASGEACTLNTDCAEPLVCGLDRCRRQCDDSRDCAAGLRCLRDGPVGVCQLPDESRCSLDSECMQGLVCRLGTCTTECREDRDCAPGAVCELDATGSRACVEPTAELCVYNSDCPEGLVCHADQVCRIECAGDVDCDPLRYCDDRNRCVPRADAGP
ncbi:MAG: hypothetical protein M5U28_00090 [Sandaracinaceae bacterium]|nr:hypothetical protein [Sandaracinaceae bacterium]